MISVDEAYQCIRSFVKGADTETTPLLKATGNVLSEPVFADRDLPPYDRVMMDGIAINSKSFNEGQRQFLIEKMAAAGSSLQSLNVENNCIEVMTGAILPTHTDAVVPYEQLTIHDNIAEIKTDNINPFQHIHKKGTDAKKNDILINKNILITPAHISVMATVGMHQVPVYKVPSIAVCSTGDELVEVTQTPLAHQVRQSNIYFIIADLQKENIQENYYHLRDDKEEMVTQLRTIFQNHDVVLLSGAVSKGKKDYLPQALTDIGMQTIFHQVAQRPGKPFLFGNIDSKLVFGFPGNPVSTFVCYHLYFKQWLQYSLHLSSKKITAKLSTDVVNSSFLTLHVLVKLSYKEGCCFAVPIGLSSSGDIPALIEAEGIISLPPDKKTAFKDEVFEVIPCN